MTKAINLLKILEDTGLSNIEIKFDVSKLNNDQIDKLAKDIHDIGLVRTGIKRYGKDQSLFVVYAKAITSDQYKKLEEIASKHKVEIVE